MITLGIDPDTKNIGLALVDMTNVRAVALIHQSRGPTKEESTIKFAPRLVDALSQFVADADCAHPAIVVIESQDITLGRSKAVPQHILYLAQIAGALVCAAAIAFPRAEILMPKPQKWKGSIPKHVSQKRILNEIGWEFDVIGDSGLPCPSPDLETLILSNITPSRWQHCIDAIGIARWGSRKALS